MRRVEILRVVAAKLLIPYILLFALYVQFHGDFGPGGGFQAGVIFGAAFVLFALIFGLDKARRVAPKSVVDTLIALGLLLYAGTGVVTMLRGGNYLHYDWLDPHYTEADALDGLRSVHGQHWGIFAVELGVGLTVAAGMITIYFSFAGRGRRDS